MKRCLQPIRFCEAIALLYLTLYLLSRTVPLSSQSVTQLHSASMMLAWTWCLIRLSRIWLMVLILQDILEGWLHCRRCSLVSTAPHKWHVSVSWYSCVASVSAVGRRSLQHFVVITSLWILLIASERHFHSISSTTLSSHWSYHNNKLYHFMFPCLL